MARDLTPADVAARLEALAAAYVPETAAEARARMEPPMPRMPLLSPDAVSQRLAELRALLELTDYLHRARR